MGKSFERVRLCTVGKLKDADKIPGWVRANGGEYTKDVDGRTTHLVTTKEAYIQNVPAVQTAKTLKKVKIVNFDWLEDSLLSKTRRPLKEAPYIWETIISGKPPDPAPSPTPQKKPWDPFLRLSRKGAKGVPRGRPYHEPDDGDIWEATLVRTCNPPHRREKYQLAVCFNELQKAYQWNTNGLQIIQSIAKRPTYATYAKYSRVGLSKVELLAPPLKNPSAAMKKFMEFFKEQTGVEWADRKTEKLPPPKCNDDGEPLPPHEGWYHMETHTNLFTDYLKSWQQPTGPSGADIHGQSGLMTDDSNLQSTDLAAISEELSQNHALLASLISKDLEISDGVKPTEEEKDEEDSVREDLIRSLTCTEDGKSNK